MLRAPGLRNSLAKSTLDAMRLGRRFFKDASALLGVEVQHHASINLLSPRYYDRYKIHTRFCISETNHRLAHFLHEDSFTVINQSDTPKSSRTIIPPVDHHDCIRGQTLGCCYRCHRCWRRGRALGCYHHHCMVLRTSSSSSQTESWHRKKGEPRHG